MQKSKDAKKLDSDYRYDIKLQVYNYLTNYNFVCCNKNDISQLILNVQTDLVFLSL